jgi:hypothetical protein
MRKRLLIGAGTVLAAAATSTAAVLASASTANATGSLDLSMTGSVVAGVKTVEVARGTHVAFSFTMKNNSTSLTSNDVSFNFTFTHTSDPGMEFYECPLVSTHVAINPDTPSCEPGGLGPGKSTQAAVIVVPISGYSSMTVKACASNLDGTPDPVSSNNCKSLTVAVIP